MQSYKIFNEDCFKTMKRLQDMNKKADLILTSPPYNTGRNHGSMDNHERRYDIYLEKRNIDNYTGWSVELFNEYDKILKENGCVLYNMSYGNENPEQMYLVIASILQNTNFTLADTIVWKKKSALPNNVSKNKLTRICEFVFVFCRIAEYKTFETNKQIKSVSRTGQNYYENIFAYIEAPNNDGKNDLNKATYSTELCTKLLEIYAKSNSIIYDSFNGTGTTGIASLRLGHKYIGSELSKAQCEYSEERLKGVLNELQNNK